MASMRAVLFFLPFLFLNSACTRSSGYRQSPALTLEKLDHKVSLGHVEIDDQGELISFDQLKRVTAKIKAESSEPLLLVVYIHGWNHNASARWITGDGDLDDFRDVLKDLGKASGKKTMGVFVSWRGRSLATFPVGVDYFHRHGAARRVGGVGGTEVLHELGAAARGANSKNRIVMVGHSLGGAVLESAMAESIAARVATDSARGRKLKRKDFPADLMVSINSAESAIYARQLLSTFKNRGIKEIEGGPLMVSLTSQRDFVTSAIWPIGNIMGRWVPGINFFNTGVAGMYRKDPKEDKLRGTQAAAHRTTVGHFKPLFSHQFEKMGEQERSLEELYRDNRNARDGNGFIVRGEKAVYRFTRPEGPYYNDTPYWIVPIPGPFIRHHQDHWNPNFVGLLTAMMSLTR
ncbi:hypothetical protein N9Y81_03780 [Akkermansiaceae bacterium]|nr:hypothetical protein [Akkermansiaceae bacterium]